MEKINIKNEVGKYLDHTIKRTSSGGTNQCDEIERAFVAGLRMMYTHLTFNVGDDEKAELKEKLSIYKQLDDHIENNPNLNL